MALTEMQLKYVGFMAPLARKVPDPCAKCCTHYLQLYAAWTHADSAKRKWLGLATVLCHSRVCECIKFAGSNSSWHWKTTFEDKGLVDHRRLGIL